MDRSTDCFHAFHLAFTAIVERTECDAFSAHRTQNCRHIACAHKKMAAPCGAAITPISIPLSHMPLGGNLEHMFHCRDGSCLPGHGKPLLN